ncbi:MAG: hypothetical protein V3R99_13045 [Thermoguttaceae bacterium]
MKPIRKSTAISILLVSLAMASLTPAVSEEPIRRFSGIYPHLTTYGIYSQDGAHRKTGHNECGIGAVVPWADRLWMINYAPHMPGGSEHKLYSVDENLTLSIHPESVGGTPAGRMIHRESNQLLIGPYLIDVAGKVRVISPRVMPGRLTAIMRHLRDPANRVYYFDMEGMLYEANVHTLEVTKLFHKPLPGWHGKGAYTAQGRVVLANNGERSSDSYRGPLITQPESAEAAGVLAEWDGTEWRIVERRQFTDVTGPGGIYGSPDDDSPLWAIGWDRRSLRLKLLDDGRWHTFLLPKATHNNDPRHGWYTEWPRIREIGDGRLMMDMHGMFFDFPKTFCAADTSGLKPIASHLRYIPDFCDWNGQLVLASDETSIQGNPMAGQPQSNLWMGRFEDLKTWGPASAYGGPWVVDPIRANTPSDPFLIGGFDRRTLHLSLGGTLRNRNAGGPLRASDQQAITSMPETLARLPRVTINRGDFHKPAPGYSFTVDRPVTIYLAVDQRGAPNPGAAWTKTELTLTWGANHRDSVYRRDFAAGAIEIPGNDVEHVPGDFGMPHTALVACDGNDAKINPAKPASVANLRPEPTKPATADGPVRFTLEIDTDGRGEWKAYKTIEVPADGYAFHVFPEDIEAQWIRLAADKDCIATAYLHLTDENFHDGSAGEELFAGLAEADDSEARAALVYAAKRNRNLRVIAGDGRHFELDKSTFEFHPDEKDEELADLLEVEPEFTVDGASVILTQGTRRLRLPKGSAAFDRPFASGWPRGSREVESERHLANFHGTFYEVPLITNGRPPAFDRMRPVASHTKQITDFCTWNGLLVLAGIHPAATNDDHVVGDPAKKTALWFGGVDDLWRLGKPVGQGGPWYETAVKAGQPSDPYLMTGYDKKTLTLSVDRDVIVTIEVDVDHQSGWKRYGRFPLSAGKESIHEFPVGFSAHWIRFITDHDCTATARLVYR